MWEDRFNHLAAVAAAKERAAQLRARSRMLGLLKLMAVANRDEMRKKQLQLQTRQRGLEQFIHDPYPANSLCQIGFERDCRAILEAGSSGGG